MKLILREDDSQRVYITERTLDVIDLLKSEYDYIYESIENEGFIIKAPTCSLFKELLFENQVVGFCSYDFSREFLTAALNNIYVLPEFRGNGLFLSELKKTMSEHNKPSIVEPTRLVVELLVKYGFAYKLSENIVASAIEFVIPGEHVMSNIDYGAEEELSTHYYDLETCSSFHFLDLENASIAYSSPLNYDIIHYDCLDKRMDKDESHLMEVQKLFLDNENEFKEIILKLEKDLPIITYSLEEIIGDDENLSLYIESLVDDAHVSLREAYQIKEQIREEYESGMILDESLMIRLAYLFDRQHEVRIKSHSEKCPYCQMPIDNHDRYCHFCGIALNNV